MPPPDRPPVRSALLPAGAGGIVGGLAGGALGILAITFGPQALRQLDTFGAGLGAVLAGLAVGAVAGASLAVRVRRAAGPSATLLAAGALAPGVVAVLIATGGLWWRNDLLAIAILVVACVVIGAGGRALALVLDR